MAKNKSKASAENGGSRSQQRLVSPRERLLSYLSWIIGGWNASPGASAGHLHSEKCYDDDEQIVRLMLKIHESDVTRPLKEEIQKLKAELYDAGKRANDGAMPRRD